MGVNPENSKHGHELAPLNEGRLHTGHNVTIVVPANQNARNQETEEANRAQWSGKLQFFLSIIGYSVGLGNIWRFPYLCQQNGGGAFLIPFFIMLILEGIPLFLIELGLGQKMRQGALGVWNTVHPWLGGIGMAACIVTFFVALYYNVIITWCFYYLFNSLQAVTYKFGEPLLWASCPMVNGKPVEECAKSSETAYFWYRVTLDASPTIDDGQGLKWWIVICLLISWLVVFCIVMKGIQSSGKVVYFTSMFPYLVLTIFFIRGITLKGAGAGLAHMYTPKVEKLLEPKVWLDAATQVFYSFGLAFGSLIAFGSYNTVNNNCVRDVLLVSFCNAFTAIYASVVIFAILGFKAMSNVEKCLEGNKNLLIEAGLLSGNTSISVHSNEFENAVHHFNSSMNLSLDVCDLGEQLNNAAEGTGLAFIVFTQAIVELPGAPFWSCIFFLMLLALGLGSQIGLLEGMLCVIFEIDLFKRIKKQYMTGVVCIICFFVGLIFCTGAGEYWLTMFDSFAGTIGLVLVALMEMLALIFVYGHEKFTKDIEEMTGYRPGWYWQITWRFLAPIIMVAILIASVVQMIMNKPKYPAWVAALGKTELTIYPDWVLAIGVGIILIGIAPIPVVFLMRRFQLTKLDVDIHHGSIRRNDTTVSTKEMMGDVDLDDYQDRLEDFPEEDENIDSDDDNNAPPRMKDRGKAFEMKVINF
ncbi:sodium- and chloride-dependent transporter XTRP3 isoform X1 [Leptopilina boulardi]|uniref:sodium- and chloride-dependent transporter XTRP3 isoform X1 n=1 Tax=Leptopilina boulardi TaxID=63433 RepID=UPI0021F61975|nr:sodium- and chloride-dependent transporter XTRP3 isoform X1 [Leptopilina boulardi]